MRLIHRTNDDDAFTILLVEDDSRSTGTLQSVLSRPGREIVVVYTVAAALAHLRNTPDLLLVQRTLADGSGLAVIDALNERSPETETMFITSEPSMELMVEAVRLRVCHVIVKPVGNVEELERTVASALSRVSTRRALRHRYSELAKSEERHALAVEAASDGLWDWDLASNHIYFSSRWKQMLGYDDNDIGNSVDEWFGRLHRADRTAVLTAVSGLMSAQVDPCEVEYRIRHRNDTYRWVVARGTAVRDEHGRTTRMAGSQSDITERKEVEARLTHTALHDPLTGLPNRALFRDRLGQALARQRRSQRAGFAVMFIDLDHFKKVNDSFGHAAGDELLRAITARLESIVRGSDTLARLGGDEFGLLMETAGGKNEFLDVADRIHAILAPPVSIAAEEVLTSASIGIAIGDPSYEQPEDVLRDADIAMYRAKDSGRARHVVFRRSMRLQVIEMLQLERDLRLAVDREEITLHYQPIVELSSGVIAGFEALARWPAANSTWIPPSDFIPVAEETGVIVALGRQLLRTALRSLRAWDGIMPPTFFLSVNLSPKQIVEPGLADEVRQLLRAEKVDPGRLRLELTESALIGDIESVVATLTDLSEQGIQLCLDDFGTGYSSLGHLQRLPFDSLKIDQTFVRGIDINPTNRRLVGAFVSLGIAMEIGFIAEGVSRAAEAATLLEMGCVLGQGFYYSPAVSLEQATLMLQAEIRGEGAFAVGQSTLVNEAV